MSVTRYFYVFIYVYLYLFIYLWLYYIFVFFITTFSPPRVFVIVDSTCRSCIIKVLVSNLLCTCFYKGKKKKNFRGDKIVSDWPPASMTRLPAPAQKRGGLFVYVWNGLGSAFVIFLIRSWWGFFDQFTVVIKRISFQDAKSTAG